MGPSFRTVLIVLKMDHFGFPLHCVTAHCIPESASLGLTRVECVTVDMEKPELALAYPSPFFQVWESSSNWIAVLLYFEASVRMMGLDFTAALTCQAEEWI